ncbi:MAG: hypothetical protein AAF740_05170 [Bacteroidota bacterium]
MLHLHQIQAETHAEFLKQGRIDPITGETLKAGDEIVFCADCKSAFLADSWNYMEGEHCGQSDTLAEFPQPRSLSFRYEPIKLDDNFIFKDLLYEHPVVEEVYRGLFEELSHINLNFGEEKPRSKVAIYANGVWVKLDFIFGNGWRVRFKDIQKIKLVQRKGIFGNIISDFAIYLRDKRFKKVRISSNEIGLRKCLWALCRINYFIDVELQLVRKSEISFANKLIRDYEAKFKWI